MWSALKSCASIRVGALAFARAFASSAGPVRMSNSEAFVETLAAYGIKNCFGIVGSAYMDALDLFPDAGIRYISVQHEQNAAHMADGYARVSNQLGACVAQNGPGITNFVTAIAAAYWAHSPVVAITPEAGTMTKGLGGFQEVDQLPLFQPITKFQAHVNNPARMAELTARAMDIAMNERGPVQVNIPRDFFYGENDFVIPSPMSIERSAGGVASLKKAAELLANAKRPVVIAGGGVAMAGGIQDVAQLAEFVGMPVATTYLHNDSFPASHPLSVGPLGYQGSQAAMHCLRDADVVLALGTRLSPFGTNPQYGIDYWPKTAKVIQVELDPRRLSLVKRADVNIHGDAKLAAQHILAALKGAADMPVHSTREARLAEMGKHKKAWKETLDSWTFADSPLENKMIPRRALRELELALPKDAIVSTDIGNICSVSNSYLKFEQPGMLAAMTFGNCQYAFPAAIGAKVARPDRPVVSYAGDGAWGMSLNEVLTCVRENIPVTAVVFNNGQWGAEKKNQVLWFGNRFVGTNLKNPSFAEIARAMGAEGIRVTSPDAVGDALVTALANQKQGKTTVLEVMVTRELGDPFRRDAMKLPQRVLQKYKGTNEDRESATGQPTDLLATDY
mmetsp:Transcript_43606/g.110008  ORF Transcript_43606/g.110008 Transcript_43606/m.110008 type:complete len:620 (-) Transcript_43606:179-2038(-)